MKSYKVLRVAIVLTSIIALITAQNDGNYKRFEKDGKTAEANFFNAHKMCRQNGLELPTLDTAEKSAKLEKYMRDNNIPKVWMSLTDLAEEGKFVWLTTAEPINYTNWHFPQPDNTHPGEQCVENNIYEGQIKWNDLHCDYVIPFICESVVTGEFVRGQNQSRYSLPLTKEDRFAKGNFFYAYQLCKHNGKQLPTPSTEAKMKELLEFIEDYSIVKTWTSGTDLGEEGKFHWFTNGQPVDYGYWHGGQPDNYANLEHCIEVVPIYHDIKWNDVSCNANKAIIICEDLDD